MTPKIIIISIILILFFGNIYAQDALYLIDTLVGQSTTNRLHYAKGLGDINGDGYSDLIVENDDSTRIYLGNAEFELQADYVFKGWYTSYVNDDINNDGYSDFLLGTKFYYGSENFDTSSYIPFPRTYYYRMIISWKVGDIGDVNGDGYKDFAISSPYNWSNGISFVWLYLGGDSVSSEPFVTIYQSPSEEGNSEGSFGTSVAGIGDVNNDGYDDILIGDPETSLLESRGKVLLYYGGEEMDNIADTIIRNEKAISFGSNIQNEGDLDNDNKNNVIIVSGDKYHFYNGIEEEQIINGDKFGYGGHLDIGCGGDINGDGYKDFIIGNTNYKNDNGVMVGGAFIFYGDIERDTIPDYKLEGEYKWNEYSKSVEIIGDYNGDGYDDFLVIAPSYPTSPSGGATIRGKLYLYSYKNYVGVEENEPVNIKEYKLYQNYPNPFNPSTTIKYEIPSRVLPVGRQEVKERSDRCVFVTLKVYDVLGREITTLVNEEQPPGNYEVEFNAASVRRRITSGIYFYRLTTGNSQLTRKMLLLR